MAESDWRVNLMRILLLLLFTVVLSKKILFISNLSPTHSTFQLQIAHQLSQRGHEVIVASNHHSHNLTFQKLDLNNAQNAWLNVYIAAPYLKEKDFFTQREIEFYGISKTYENYFNETRKLVESMSKKPDLMVIDFFDFGSRDVANLYGIKYILTLPQLVEQYRGSVMVPSPNFVVQNVNTGYSFLDRLYRTIVFPVQSVLKMYSVLKEFHSLRAKHIDNVSVLIAKEMFDTVVLSASFPGFEVLNSVPPNVFQVGGVVPQFDEKSLSEDDEKVKKWIDSLEDDEYIIFVDFGEKGYLHQWQMETLINGFQKDENARVLFSMDLGPQLYAKTRFITIPDTVRLERKVNRQFALKHPKTKLFVSSGDLQLIFEAMDAGVPMLLIPLQGDQFGNAQRVKELGMGLTLNANNFSENDIYVSMLRIVNNRAFPRMAKRVNQLRKLAGCEHRASDIIESVLLFGTRIFMPAQDWIQVNIYIWTICVALITWLLKELSCLMFRCCRVQKTKLD